MNWKRLLLNLAGAAAAGLTTAVATGTPTTGSIIAAVIMAVAANLAGLFQHPPNVQTNQSTAAILERK